MAAVTEAKAVQQEHPDNFIEVMNPATGQLVRRLEACTPERLTEMVTRARQAQPGWQALGYDGRGKVLRRAQKWVLDNAERVIHTVVSETGKTREDVMLELSLTAMAFGFWAKRAPKYLADERVRTGSPFLLGRKVIVRYEPVGVAGVIGPWNHPLVNNIADAVRALAAGHSVILKPSGVTQFTDNIKKINAAMEKTKYPGIPSRWYQLANGGEGPHYVLVTDRNSWGDMQGPEKSMSELLKEAYGAEDKTLQALRDSFDHTVSELLEYKGALSYIPAK